MLPVTEHANAITYHFTQDGSGGKLGGNVPTPGYGSVTVTSFGSDLEFEIQLATNWSVDTRSHHAVAFALVTSGSKSVAAQVRQRHRSLSHLCKILGTGPFSNPGFSGPFSIMRYPMLRGGHGQSSCNSISSLTFFVLGAGSLSPVLTNGVYVTVDIFSEGTGKTGVVGAAVAVPGPVVGAGVPALLGRDGCLIYVARRRRRVALS